jgi:HEAT repeat protein
MTNSHDALVGFSIIAKLFGTDEDKIETAPAVALGHYDTQLRAAFAFTLFPRNDSALVEFHLERLKNEIRLGLSIAIKTLRNMGIDNAQSRFLNMNKPRPEGTTAELAQKLGISKSEVRRRKAAGTL